MATIVETGVLTVKGELGSLTSGGLYQAPDPDGYVPSRRPVINPSVVGFPSTAPSLLRHMGMLAPTTPA